MEKILRYFVKIAAALYYFVVFKNKKKSAYIPVSGKVLDFSELKNMIDASLDMWLTSGRFNDKFEAEFSKYLGCKYALTTNSGSSANLLAISALMSPKLKEKRLRTGDEIITVASGFPTTVNPIIQNGLVPVFIDCEIGTYNIDASKIEEAVSSRTKAVFVAHTLGNPFEIDKIKEICEKYGLWLIEDSCDALGSEVNSKKSGTIGHIGTFSFYPAHHITTGEGGAVVTDDTMLYKILLSLRDWGRDCSCKPGTDNTCKKRFSMQFGNLPTGYDHKYTYSHFGYNLKMTDWQAAIGLAQLKKIPNFLNIRTRNAAYLTEKLSDLNDKIILPSVCDNAKSSWFGYLISLKPGVNLSKQKMVEFLEKNGVGTRQLFAGNILRQPSFVDSEVNLRIGSSELICSNDLTEQHYSLLPNTDFVMNNTFWVGVFPALGKKELDKISDLIHKFVKENS